MTKKPQALSATTIIGDEVHNYEGESLGKIEDLMIDINTGQIAYVILSFGGMLGIGNKLFAVPWPSLRLNAEEKVFEMNADKELLQEAPGFDKDDWPEIRETEDTWLVSIFEYYEQPPYWR
jgi:sporulation protein YlmC with PRC-barrel domain